LVLPFLPFIVTTAFVPLSFRPTSNRFQ
jgi:hypothetical protein